MSPLEQQVADLTRELDELRLAICGGEDAPGHNASLSHATILQVLADNYRSWHRDSQLAWDGETANSWKARALSAESKLAEAVKVLGPFARDVDEFADLPSGWHLRVVPFDYQSARTTFTAGDTRAAATFLASLQTENGEPSTPKPSAERTAT